VTEIIYIHPETAKAISAFERYTDKIEATKIISTTYWSTTLTPPDIGWGSQSYMEPLKEVGAGVSVSKVGNSIDIELTLPGIDIHTSADASNFEVKLDYEYCWGDPAWTAKNQSRVLFAARFWFDAVIHQIWGLFRVPDEIAHELALMFNQDLEKIHDFQGSI
jgi:hypothetical protein